MTTLYIICALLLGFVFGRITHKTIRPASKEELDTIRTSAKEALRKRTQDRKAEILRMMEHAYERYEDLKACGLEAERKGIHRSDVEALLKVHPDTARTYLDELEEEGKIKQIGSTGKNVYYMLASKET